MDKVQEIKEMMKVLVEDLERDMGNAQEELENMKASPSTIASHQAVCLKYFEAQAGKKAINQLYSYIKTVVDKEQS